MFLKELENIVHATEVQKQKELWDVEGVLKQRSNQRLKFDLRPLIKENQSWIKKGSTRTRANKIVIESRRSWMLIDVEELHQYIKINKTKVLNIKELMSILDWNIILKKNKE